MTEGISTNRVVSIVVEDIAKTQDGYKVTAQVPAFESQYPTTFTRVPAEIADQLKSFGAYSVEILRESLKRDKDGSRDWHYYWGLVKFAAPDPLPIDADDAFHLGLGPDPSVDAQLLSVDELRANDGEPLKEVRRDPTRSSIEHQKSLDLAGRDYWKAVEYKIIAPPSDANTVMYQIKLWAYNYDWFLAHWSQPDPPSTEEEEIEG